MRVRTQPKTSTTQFLILIGVGAIYAMLAFLWNQRYPMNTFGFSMIVVVGLAIAGLAWLATCQPFSRVLALLAGAGIAVLLVGAPLGLSAPMFVTDQPKVTVQLLNVPEVGSQLGK